MPYSTNETQHGCRADVARRVSERGFIGQVQVQTIHELNESPLLVVFMLNAGCTWSFCLSHLLPVISYHLKNTLEKIECAASRHLDCVEVQKQTEFNYKVYIFHRGVLE